ncbi:MAG TPA: MFS transporter [Thermomicrobiales bacterium]|nr:MFS transporter [Thermomicrobiales bacterium]
MAGEDEARPRGAMISDPSAGARPSTAGAWRALLLGPILALALLPSNVVATALPLLRDEWHAGATALGWVFAAYQAGYVAAVLLVLPLTDRFPAGRVIAACAAVNGVAFLGFPLLAHGVWSASALRALAGAGLAGIYLPGARVVAAAAPGARRGLAVSAYVSAFYFGSSLSLWATGALLPAFGWRGAAYLLGAASVVGAPLAALATRGAPAPEGGAARLSPGVLRHEPIARTIAAYTAHSWELYVSRAWLAGFLATVLAARGADTLEAASRGGQWAALMVGLGTAGVWVGGWLSDHVGRARAAVAIATVSGALSLAFGWLGGAAWALLVATGCAYGLLLAADSGIYSAAVIELAPPGRIGSAQAAQAFVGFLATILAPVAAGVVLDLGGGFGGAFTLAGAVGLLGALALAPLARRAAVGRGT